MKIFKVALKRRTNRGKGLEDLKGCVSKPEEKKSPLFLLIEK